MTKRTVAVVGPGQLGRVFAGGLVATGHTVVPVRRGEPLGALDPSLSLVLVATGETELPSILSALPGALRDRAALLQNDLGPDDWRAHGVVDPTIAVVWFEKRKGAPAKTVLPTVVLGPNAALLSDALAAMDGELASAPPPLAHALVTKNVYILGSNTAAELAADATITTGTLLDDDHRGHTRAVLTEVLAVERARFARGGLVLESRDDDVLADVERAFLAEPTHRSGSRSGPARLARLRARAATLGVSLDVLR